MDDIRPVTNRQWAVSPTNENWVHGRPSASWSLKELIGWELYTSVKWCVEMEVGALRFNETINGTGHVLFKIKLSNY